MTRIWGLVCVAVVLAGCGAARAGVIFPHTLPASRYHLTLRATAPRLVAVGDVPDIEITARNRGARIPALVLDIAGLGDWRVGPVVGCTGHTSRELIARFHAFDVGSLAAGRRCTVTVFVHASSAGSRTVVIIPYCNRTVDRHIDTRCHIADRAANITLTIRAVRM